MNPKRADGHPHRTSIESFHLQRENSASLPPYSERASEFGSTVTLAQATDDPFDITRPPLGPQGPRKRGLLARYDLGHASNASVTQLIGDTERERNREDSVDLRRLPISSRSGVNVEENEASESDDSTIRSDHQRRKKTRTSMYSLYHGGNEQQLRRTNHSPQFPSSLQRGASDFSNLSNQSNLTLVASRFDLQDDIENQAKLAGFDGFKPLPLEPPPTPTIRRVVRRVGVCTGICCFGTLVIVVAMAVVYMMMSVNAKLESWGRYGPVLPNFVTTIAHPTSTMPLLQFGVMGPSRTVATSSNTAKA